MMMVDYLLKSTHDSMILKLPSEVVNAKRSVSICSVSFIFVSISINLTMKKEWTVDHDLKGSDSGDMKNGGTVDEKGELGKEDSVSKSSNSGLGYGMTAFFMVAQMAGAGFLSLPRALANAGWGGAVMVVVFCVSIGFSAVRLGICWIILEERWPEYKETVRQPYMEIAFRAFGIHGRRTALACILITLTGSTIVFIILMAEMMNTYVPALSQCQWSLVAAAIVLPLIQLGSPKDFWQASVLAVLATVVAVVVIVGKMLYDKDELLEANPEHPAPTVSSFSLGFGAILFSYGGSSVFPTIQNDMRNRSDFWKSVIISFSTILLMYFPVSVIGYILIGDAVESNILLSVGPGIVIMVAIGLQIVNLLGTYIISCSPVVQSIEDIIGIPTTFGWQRVAVRSTFVVFELVIAFSIPNFGLILNLVGGSTMSCLSFILPPLMYMRLVDDKSNKSWPERNIALWERVYLWAIATVGVIGGICATVSAVMAIMQASSFKSSCFMNFSGIES